MSHDRGSSDPLPFIQLDRSARAKASMLAQQIGIAPQHTMGSIIDFWYLCGDPRELERLLLSGVESVVLTPAEVSIRFKLASGGEEVEPWLLASVGFLEEVEGGNYRVRGMSRFFAPVKKRIANRERAKVAGLASAKSRKERFGSAQPKLTASSGVASSLVRAEFEECSNEAPNEPEPTPNKRRTKLEQPSEQTPNSAQPRGHRSESSLEAFKPDPTENLIAAAAASPAGLAAAAVEISGPLIQVDIEPPELDGSDESAGAFFDFWARTRRECFPTSISEMRPRGLEDWHAKAHAEVGAEALMASARAYFASPFGQKRGCTLSLFMSDGVWRKVPVEAPVRRRL